eukprot:3932569-Pyramimonas_sp.AAC.1
MESQLATASRSRMLRTPVQSGPRSVQPAGPPAKPIDWSVRAAAACQAVLMAQDPDCDAAAARASLTRVHGQFAAAPAEAIARN